MDSALNTPFSDWGNILFNTTIATAIADLLVENSKIFMFGGDSLRKTKNPNSPAEQRALPSIKRRAVTISRAGGVRRVTPQRRCPGGRGPRLPLVASPPHMF